MGLSAAAQDQTYVTGQSVFASPSGASNDWYSGCIVGAGRSNSSYQVECGGTTYWISGEHISTRAPEPAPDPMSPGRMVTPVITPSHPLVPAGTSSTPRGGGAGGAPPTALAATSGSYDTGSYAAGMARRIQQDRADARSARLAVGKYECRVGGQYTFSDLYITGPTSYRVAPGGTGAYRFAGGALTFTSGPYAGAYAEMVDGRTVGISSDGTHNLATQCERSN